jgi:hypothetical protein
MNAKTPKSSAPIPIIHMNSKSVPPKSGGFYQNSYKSDSEAGDLEAKPKSQLLIGVQKKLSQHKHVDPVELAKHKALLAHNALLVPPAPPKVIPVEEVDTQTVDPVLLKHDLDSLNDYQTWIASEVDPYIKVLFSIPTIRIDIYE